jgi:phage gp36-like protein
MQFRCVAAETTAGVQDVNVLSTATDAINAASLAADASTELNAAVLSAISGIGSGTGAALNFACTTDSGKTDPLNSISKVGTVPTADEYLKTTADNGVYEVITAAGSAIDWVYKFSVGSGRVGSKVTFNGYLAAAAPIGTKSVNVYAYNWTGTPGWDLVANILGQTTTTDVTRDITLLSAHTGTGANAGIIYIRFTNAGNVTSLNVDQFTVSAQNLGQTIGYADGSIWIGGTNANTTPYVDGTADNPCTYAASKTLAASLGLTRFRVRNGTTITLDASTTNKSFIGSNWTLALGSQDISGSYFEGCTVTGSGSGTTSATFVDCKFGDGSSAAVVIPPMLAMRCGVNCIQNYPLTAATAGNGQYVFTDCYSLVAGSGTPYFDFSPVTGTSGVNFRRWSGGSNITLDSNCTLTMEVVTGGGQTIITGGASCEIRGICRAITITLGTATTETVQIDCVTGPIVISGNPISAIVRAYGIASSCTQLLANTEIYDYTISRTAFNSEVDTALADINLDHLVGTASGIPSVPAGTFLDQIMDNGSASFDRATDSLQAIRDRGDAAWTTAIGFSTHTAADVKTAIEAAGSHLALILADTGTDIPATLTEIKGATWSSSTDTLEAIRDRGDAAWVTGSVTAPTAAQVADAVLDELVSAHTISGSLSDTIYDIKTTVNTISSGTGDGAYSITITVVDQVDLPIENAFVRVTLGATSYTGYTNASGEISFSCDAGTWTVGITAAGYGAFSPATLIITDDTDQEYSLTAATTTADTFAEAQDLYDMFGEANVKEWANMEELSTTAPTYTTEINRRVTASLTYATEEIKELLRDGPYEEDFTTVPTSIKRCCCMKAGAWLFEWRRDDDENDRYSRMEERANRLLEEIKRGARQFDSTIQTVKGTRAPGVV